MRLACFRAAGADKTRVGVVEEGGVAEFAGTWTELLSRCCGPGPHLVEPTGPLVPFEACRFVEPFVPAARGLFCVGMNYWEHDAEIRGLLRAAPSEHPVFFWKLADTMAPATAELVLDPAVSEQFDWEVELGVVIGRHARAVAPEDVGEYLAGYVIVNDVTARDLQRQHVQWFLGKNVHASSPVGPWVTTIDEAGYPPRLEMELSVNGVNKQRAVTTDLIFDVPTLVATLTRSVELQPGDIIATGTPMGVGFARNPPEFLRDGDVVEAHISTLGTQRNVVVGAPWMPTFAPTGPAHVASDPDLAGAT